MMQWLHTTRRSAMILEAHGSTTTGVTRTDVRDSTSGLRRKMKYAVYKRIHKEHGRWYTKPLEEGASEDYAYVFKGVDATILACQKAQQLNEEEGRLALAA